jgi:hypothetical protein
MKASRRITGAVGLRLAGMLAAFLLLGSLAGHGIHGGQGGRPAFPGAAHAWDREIDGQDADDIFVRLEGPNDGEPINSRLLLKVSTNATEGGSLQVSANGVLLYSRPFRFDLRYDEEQSLYVTEVDVDIDLLQRLFPARFLDPDAAPFTITVALYSTDGSHMITYGDWTGYLGKPWVDVVNLHAVRGGGNGDTLDGETPLGMVRVVVHPLAKDTFYFFLASPDRELLTLSPEEPQLLRHARKLSAGSCGDGEKQVEEILLHLDRVTDLPWEPSYMVLWSFDFYGGWKRSAIIEH